MAYISNLQRETYNENSVTANNIYTVATFQVNKPSTGGGSAPYSLFKVQANWSSGSLLVNSELYVNQFVITPMTSSPAPYYLPDGETGNTDGNFPISGSTNASKYGHLIFSDNSDIYEFFKISFPDLVDDPNDPSNYYLASINVTTPNYNDGKLIVDASCYILNTV